MRRGVDMNDIQPGTDDAISHRHFERHFHAWISERGGRTQEVTYERSHGGTCSALFVAAIPPAKGLVVVAHATGNDKYFTFIELFRLMHEERLDIFAFDLDGHGRQSTHLLSGSAVESMLQEAIAAARRFNIDAPLHLLGQSLGALLILHLLQKGDTGAGPIRSAVLLSSPIRGRIERRRLWRECLLALKPSWHAAIQIYGAWGLLPAVGPFKRSLYPMRFGPDHPESGIAAYISFVDELVQRFQIGKRPIDGTTPCLLLYGEDDALTPPTQATEIKGSLRPPSQVQVVQGETHFTLPLSSKCHAQVRAWLRARSEN